MAVVLDQPPACRCLGCRELYRRAACGAQGCRQGDHGQFAGGGHLASSRPTGPGFFFFGWLSHGDTTRRGRVAPPPSRRRHDARDRTARWCGSGSPRSRTRVTPSPSSHLCGDELDGARFVSDRDNFFNIHAQLRIHCIQALGLMAVFIPAGIDLSVELASWHHPASSAACPEGRPSWWLAALAGLGAGALCGLRQWRLHRLCRAARPSSSRLGMLAAARVLACAVKTR